MCVYVYIIRIYVGIYLLYSILMELLSMIGFRRLRLIKQQVKDFLFVLTTKKYLDRLSWLHRLRRSRLYSPITHYLSHTLFHTLSRLSHTVSYWLPLSRTVSHSDSFLLLSSFIYPKMVLHFRIIGYISSEWITSSRELPGVNSFSRDCLCSGRNIRSCALASLITRLWYMPPLIIPFFYTTYIIYITLS